MKQTQIDTLRDLVQAEIKAVESGESTYDDNDAEREHLRQLDAELLAAYERAES